MKEQSSSFYLKFDFVVCKWKMYTNSDCKTVSVASETGKAKVDWCLYGPIEALASHQSPRLESAETRSPFCFRSARDMNQSSRQYV